MYGSFRPSRFNNPTLIVSPEDGFLAEIPDEPLVSRQYVENHPFIKVTYDEERRVEQVVCGHGVDDIVYDIIRDTGGFLLLSRVRAAGRV